MSNVITEDEISGNIINTVSDHLGQFLILPYHSIMSNSKWEILQRNFKNFSKKNFLSGLKKINWKSIFVWHAWSNYITEYQRKFFLEKPWLKERILQSIKQKKHTANSLEVKKHSSKNSNITKSSLTNLQELIRQILQVIL